MISLVTPDIPTLLSISAELPAYSVDFFGDSILSIELVEKPDKIPAYLLLKSDGHSFLEIGFDSETGSFVSLTLVTYAESVTTVGPEFAVADGSTRNTGWPLFDLSQWDLDPAHVGSDWNNHFRDVVLRLMLFLDQDRLILRFHETPVAFSLTAGRVAFGFDGERQLMQIAVALHDARERVILLHNNERYSLEFRLREGIPLTHYFDSQVRP